MLYATCACQWRKINMAECLQMWYKTYLIGGWRAIHNYMDDNNINALSRANKIMIF